MRTTLDLADPVLKELKEVSKEEGGSLGEVASRLLADALSVRGRGHKSARKLDWSSQPMQAKVDLADKNAVYRALEGR
ncbi:MAG: hypothetical protein ACKOKC_14795 [Chthoniobacterales bacterium]